MQRDDVPPSGLLARQQIDPANLNGATPRSVDAARIGARVVEDGPDLVAVLDAELICRYANPAWEAVLGYRRDQLLGRPITAIEHPPDAGRIAQYLDALILRPGTTERWDVRIRHRDGSIRWLEIVARNRHSDPELAGFLLVAREVSERKAMELTLRRGEARFRALVHHSSDIITIIDADGIARYQSPSLERVLGYAPEELIGANPFTLIHPEEVGPVRELFDQVVSQPGASESARFRFRHKDGSWRWLEVIGTNLLDDPSVNGVVVNSRDVTDRQRAEDDLREREQRHREISAAARRQAQELALLGEVRTALAREIELPELIRTVVGAIERTFGYTLVSLYLLEGDDLVLQHQVGYEQWIRRIPITSGTAGRVVRTGKPVLLEDVSSDPAFLGAIEGIVSEVCVPLNDQGCVVGILNVESTSGIQLSEADLRLMIALSEHVSIAIGRARLYSETRASASRFQALVQHADLMGIIEREGVIRYLSPAVEAVLGYAPEELIGSPSAELVHVDDRAAVMASFAQAQARPCSQTPLECRMQRKDGTSRWIEIRFSNLLADPSVDGIVVNGRDVTERKEIEAQLRHQAQHDPLTGLPNRALFLERLTQELGRARARHDGQGVPVLYLDLDGFKVVNDSLGHAAGDRLLIAVAERLRTFLRAEDVIARFGGDEFAVLLSCSTELATAINLADRIIDALSSPFELEGQEAVVSTSVGIVAGMPDIGEPSDLLRAADVALYRAKVAGKGSVAVFDPARDEAALARLDRETALRRALERDELRAVYQPVINLATGAVVGVEALARWEHPERGLLPPEAFIALAEETKLILPLGRWMRSEACRQVRRWQAMSPLSTPMQLSINISASELHDPDLANDLSRTLRESGLPPRSLTLEVTENAAMAADLEEDIARLQALKRLGVRLAMDDFGTGYASLSALRRLPVDELKIDLSFVAGLGRNHEDTAIVRATVGVAAALGLRVTAEGVETAEQVTELLRQGCQHGQGYFFAPPLATEELVNFLHARSGGAVLGAE